MCLHLADRPWSCAGYRTRRLVRVAFSPSFGVFGGLARDERAPWRGRLLEHTAQVHRRPSRCRRGDRSRIGAQFFGVEEVALAQHNLLSRQILDASDCYSQSARKSFLIEKLSHDGRPNSRKRKRWKSSREICANVGRRQACTGLATQTVPKGARVRGVAPLASVGAASASEAPTINDVARLWWTMMPLVRGRREFGSAGPMIAKIANTPERCSTWYRLARRRI